MIVSITGPIGSGKTTLLGRLQQRNGQLRFAEEPVDDWVSNGWLDEYYKDQSRYGLWFQLQVLQTQVQALEQQQENGETLVIERSPLDGQLVFGKQLFEQGTMPAREYELLCFFAERCWRPDALVVLDVPTEQLVERIRVRDRAAEQSIDTHYYDQIQHRYEALQKLPMPTLVLEPYALEQLDCVCERIEQFIAGL